MHTNRDYTQQLVTSNIVFITFFSEGTQRQEHTYIIIINNEIHVFNRIHI